MRESLDSGLEPFLDGASTINLIFFLVNAKGSEELRDDFESRFPIEEAKKEFQKFIKAIQENLDKLGFFESGDPKKIQKDLELSCERAINKETPKPESRVELSAYRSYIPDEFDTKDTDLFNSLERNSQSILMICAVILSAVNAINQANQNSTDQPEIYKEILKPLIKYSQVEKTPHKINKYLFHKQDPAVSVIGGALNWSSVMLCWFIQLQNSIEKNKESSFYSSYKSASPPVAGLELLLGFTGVFIKNNNYDITPLKLIRNQATLSAITALTYYAKSLFKGNSTQDEIFDSVLFAHWGNVALGLALSLPNNPIKRLYENIDNGMDNIKLPNIWGSNLTKSKDIEINQSSKVQEKFWNSFLSKLVKKSEEIDLQQSPKSSPRSEQVTKVDEDFEIQPVR
jgi:hypothetical protein